MGVDASMEVSALRYPGARGAQSRSPLLRLQSDDRLVSATRRGNQAAFEVIVSRYQSKLLGFCRHMLGSREDAEDVLQDVLAASYTAMLADDRPLNLRPWLYRIARNRCLNHLRRNTAIGVDSMDTHLADHGISAADRVYERAEFRQLVNDISDLPETQRTALVLRELDDLSYEQIAEAMETTVSSVKSLLVRARVSLTEAAEARLLSCEQVREELAEVSEGLKPKITPAVRRHVKNCQRCAVFQKELRRTDKALAALAPLGPALLVWKLMLAHLFGHSASGSAGAVGISASSAGASAGAVGTGAVGAAAGGASTGGVISAGVGAIATKTAAGFAAAALLTAGTVAVSQSTGTTHQHRTPPATVISGAISTGVLRATTNESAIAAVSAHSAPGIASETSQRARHMRHVQALIGARAQASAALVGAEAHAGAVPAITSRHAKRTAGRRGTAKMALGVGITTASGGVSFSDPNANLADSGPVTPVVSAASGTATTPSGTATTPSGTATTPSGTATTPSGTATTPSGIETNPGATSPTESRLPTPA
ncbi:MAG: sigma-70 family RNA polymerase sigma factor [Solirubrobacteraceae bacterium]